VFSSEQEAEKFAVLTVGINSIRQGHCFWSFLGVPEMIYNAV
jgi:hypothetical protein